MKKGQEKKMLLFHCLQVCHLSGFPWNYALFPLGYFLPLFRSILYQKIWTNGHSRCLGHLGAHFFICVGSVGLCVMCGPQLLNTWGREVFLTEKRESLLHGADRTPVLLLFCSPFPCLLPWLIAEAWGGSRVCVRHTDPKLMTSAVKLSDGNANIVPWIRMQFSGK